MKRKDFMQIIKLRSAWKIDRRIGNYKLPGGKWLSAYVADLVESQMKIDNLLIGQDGNLHFGTGGDWNTDIKDFEDYTLMPAMRENEICTYHEMERRIKALVSEIIG